MKCITRRNYISRGQQTGSKLYARQRNGDERPLFEDCEALRLTVTGGQYRLTCKQGGVIRQGQSNGSPESIFEIYDSTGADLPTDFLKLELPGYSGSFFEYEQIYGHNRVERVTKRRFVVFTESTEGGTGFGFVERKNGLTTAIHSVYVPQELSRREKARFVVKYIYELLKANEYASVSYSGITIDGVNVHEYGFGAIKCRPAARDADILEEAHLLYLDALKRKQTVTEVFSSGAKYKPRGLFKAEEVKGGKGVKDNA